MMWTSIGWKWWQMLYIIFLTFDMRYVNMVLMSTHYQRNLAILILEFSNWLLKLDDSYNTPHTLWANHYYNKITWDTNHASIKYAWIFFFMTSYWWKRSHAVGIVLGFSHDVNLCKETLLVTIIPCKTSIVLNWLLFQTYEKIIYYGKHIFNLHSIIQMISKIAIYGHGNIIFRYVSCIGNLYIRIESSLKNNMKP